MSTSENKNKFSSFPPLKSSLSNEQLSILGELERKNNCFKILRINPLTKSEKKQYKEFKDLRDADLIEWEKYSKQEFAKLKTFDDLIPFGVGIIQNKFLSPGYSCRFHEPEVSDNPFTTTDMVDTFASINRLGLFTTNCQNGYGSSEDTTQEYQRAYIAGMCREWIAKYLCSKLNRIPGIVAYSFKNTKLEPTANIIDNQWVTYDGKDTFTRMGNLSDIDNIHTWNKKLAKEILKDSSIVSINIVDTLERDTLFKEVNKHMIDASKLDTGS